MTNHKDSFQVQRLEVVNTGRRRRWSVTEKLRIVDESFQGRGAVFFCLMLWTVPITGIEICPISTALKDRRVSACG